MPPAQAPRPKFCFTEADILFDEHEVVAVNKPPGLPSQATRDPSMPHVGSCLEEYFRSRGRSVAPLVLVHRPDKETSGVILLAHGNERATWLARQFQGREVQKRYHALCHGLPEADDLEVRSHLSEIDRKTGRVRTVHSGGQLAVTRFHVLRRAPGLGLSLIACEPHTGRSHQLRVQCAKRGLPIVGDQTYGDFRRNREFAKATRQKRLFLHSLATDVRYSWAGREWDFSARSPLPPEFAAALGG